MNSQGAVKPRSEGTPAKRPAADYKYDAAKPVSIPKQKPRDRSEAKTYRFLAGTRLDCPVQNVDIRGISFQRFSGGQATFTDSSDPNKRRHVNDARDLGARRWGCWVDLTEAQVKAVAEDVSNKVMRPRSFNEDGTPKTGRIVSTLGVYKRSPVDEPLGHYVYLIPESAVQSEDIESGDHPPMMPLE